MSIRSSRMLATVVAAVALVASVAAVANARSEADIYSVHQLVGDTATTGAPAVDASLVNGWGLSAGPTTPWWTANNGSNTSTLYSGTGVKAALTVAVPGGPTGTVFNGNAAAFTVSQSGKSGAARFLFATEGGTILGWSPTVNGTAALVGADRSATGAVYKGLAIANDKLYATDFHNGRVDVFDKSFAVWCQAASRTRRFRRALRRSGSRRWRQHLRHLRKARRGQEGRHCRAPGQGYVDEFTPDGTLVARVVNSQKTNAPLNAPWGLALAPADFSVFAGDLLVGNFGNGRISAYTKRGAKWVYKGQLRHADGTPIEIDGLWAIAFGNGSAAGPTNDPLLPRRPEPGVPRPLLGSITAG